jgi:DNA-binding transcriptional MerR regulator
MEMTAKPLNLTLREDLRWQLTTAMNDDSNSTSYIQIGGLAKASGLTVRALHHYDSIGLLVPAERSQSGRRLYSEENVRRLYRIAALRQLGLSLDAIAAVLDRDPDLAASVREHLAQVEQDLTLQRRLHRTLTRILELLEREQEPTLEEFITAIEVMTMMEKYYEPEQRQQLERRRQELGDERIRQAEREWAELIEAVKAEQASGRKPTDAPMRELAHRWQELVEQFTGGDEGISRSLARMYREEGPKVASRGMVDADLMRYVGEAMTALREPRSE